MYSKKSEAAIQKKILPRDATNSYISELRQYLNW